LKSKLFLPVLLTVLLALVPAYGNGATLGVEPQTRSVSVGSNFGVDVWIRGLPASMCSFVFVMTWNPILLKYVSHSTSLPNPQWSMSVDASQVNTGRVEVHGHLNVAGGITTDRRWITVNFQCLGLGSSQIVFSEESWMDYEGGFTLSFTHLPGTVTQTTGGSSVGGVVLATNRVTVLAPYLVMIGLVAVGAAVYATKRKR